MSTHVSMTSQQNTPESVYVLGVRVDRVSQEQALARITEIVARRRASGNQQSCQQLITVNPEFVMAAQHDPDFRKAINAAALVVADGVGVVWATRYLRAATPERITGVDTLVEMARRCADAGYSLYLLGAAPGVAEETATRLQSMAPGLQIAGTYAGSPAPAEE